MLTDFRWHERGGPLVTAPKRFGFGTSLLKTMFANARLDYAVDGLTCDIEVTLEGAKSVSWRIECAFTHSSEPEAIGPSCWREAKAIPLQPCR